MTGPHSPRSFSAPKCGRGKPALVRRHTLEDRSELISCIENGNYAKAARIAAGEPHAAPDVGGVLGVQSVAVVQAQCYQAEPTMSADG